MSKIVTFGLGPAPAALASRTLTIRRMPDADNDNYDAVHNADAGATALVATVTLADNIMYQAKLIDALDSGEQSAPDILNFHTGSLQFPGPKTGDRLSIIAMEDESSSSSSSLSSISTSSASSSSSSQSSSSRSSLSSQSSSSLSSSSISTSSLSSSSLST